MNGRCFRWSSIATVILAGLGADCCAQELELKATLECGTRVLNSHFGRYPLGTKAIQIDARGLHFLLPPDTSYSGTVGLYSYFSVAGDMELSADFEWTPVEVPQEGRGVRCGFALETDTTIMELTRANFPGKGSIIVVTQEHVINGKREYKNEPWFATNAKTGRMALRREKKDLIILTGDTNGPLTERDRIPFTAETVRKARLFADTGGTGRSVDARLSNIKFRGAEVTTDVPLSEQGGGTNWWLIVIGLVIGATVTVVVFERIRNKD
jgi:hypothetical protein